MTKLCLRADRINTFNESKDVLHTKLNYVHVAIDLFVDCKKIIKKLQLTSLNKIIDMV